MEEAAPVETVRPPAGVVWFARIMEWLCWLGVAITVAGHVAYVFGLFPPGVISEGAGGALIGSSLEVNDPAAPDATALIRRDPVYLIAGVVTPALFVWALLSARQSFAGVGRGEYFSRSTVIGLRNLALAVLLHMTAAPIAVLIARALYMSRFEHGSISVSFGLSSQTILMLIFTAAILLICTVMAHAARIADENRQFI